MTVGQYMVTSKTGDSKWHETSAKTLTAAKQAASRMYQASAQGSIEVGIVMDYCSIETVAVKHGYERWINA